MSGHHKWEDIRGKKEEVDFIISGDDMKLVGNKFEVDVRTYAGRCAARAWCWAIVAEDDANMPLARAILNEVGREG